MLVVHLKGDVKGKGLP